MQSRSGKVKGIVALCTGQVKGIAEPTGQVAPPPSVEDDYFCEVEKRRGDQSVEHGMDNRFGEGYVDWRIDLVISTESGERMQ